MGEAGRSFIPDIQQASSSSLMSAILAGIIFNISNILLVASINLAGMAVAFPVGVGLALALGVITTYIGNPQGDPLILFLGVACVVIAIIFTAIAYGRVMQEADKSRRNKGLITAILAGIIMGWFFRFMADSMSVNFSQPASGLMTPYSALVLFAVGLFLSNFVLNTLVMKKPISGEPVNGKMYFSGSLRDHVCGWLGGMIWCVGLAFSLIASGQAGYAISCGLGQGATMIAVIWGVFIWREFASAPAGTNKLLLTMFISYIVGIVLIIAANQ
ncbi:multidrug DMT transporter permease [Escherichia coli]|nr:multidrug DMT transporter permease [Escherichia coli]